MINIDMLEGVPGVLALLSSIKHQRSQIFVTTDYFTGVHTAHTLEKRETETQTNDYMAVKRLFRFVHIQEGTVVHTCMVMSKLEGSPSSPFTNISLEASTKNTRLSRPLYLYSPDKYLTKHNARKTCLSHSVFFV